ncbi:MAG: hypothetical protein H6843_06385 [Rhodospirillaceae bacterium]|nr:hypothetical protein [Rhodospirillaceae bacterium]
MTIAEPGFAGRQGTRRPRAAFVALAGALLLAACQTAAPPPPPPEEENPSACSRTYTGGAASALANSPQGCAVAPP